MVKIISRTGKEEKFDSKDVEGELKSAGVPERIAEEIAERVEDRVEEGWTDTQVREQTQVELNRMEEDVRRARETYMSRMQSTTPQGARTEGPRERREDTSGESRTSTTGTESPRTKDRVELHA